MNADDMYPVQNLAQVLVYDDQTILSDQIPRHYMMRQIGLAWFRLMEEIFHNTPVGTRILVRRDTVFQDGVGNHVIHDYITTRTVHDTLYGCWTHQNVAYLHNEVSPYPFDIDGFTERDRLIQDNHDNQNPQVNPQPEGHMDVDVPLPAALPALPAPALPVPDLPPFPDLAALQAWAEEFLLAAPALSSNSLYTFQ